MDQVDGGRDGWKVMPHITPPSIPVMKLYCGNICMKDMVGLAQMEYGIPRRKMNKEQVRKWIDMDSSEWAFLRGIRMRYTNPLNNGRVHAWEKA